jgi:hypothetical protein
MGRQEDPRGSVNPAPPLSSRRVAFGRPILAAYFKDTAFSDFRKDFVAASRRRAVARIASTIAMVSTRRRWRGLSNVS